MSETMHPVRLGRSGSTTDDDLRTALRFALGRPGWRVEGRITEEGEAYIGVTTIHSESGDQRTWRMTRTQQGLLIYDEASGQRLGAAPTIREALVEVWEAAADVAPE